ncbi:helix-turn-helix transcriptional regulator [Petroclostridium sp. X23]|uniref:helix-turn-helix domain-containing protein n=1 Tax=Petroclostridium sp. X23 TaxID=3045146 RepID=UPI0024ACEF90|nr:helix-turn-helix transcriptional regulator [Petroclostridium sp. X23]WHH59118.1 helix-turn-helix transcriptional regulator [Petroclostridium sp. X23]
MTLGKRLAYMRKTKKLTQEDVAKIIGISRGSLAMYETDKREPDRDMLNKLADYFNVSTDYLLGRTSDPNLAVLEGENIPKEFRDIGIEHMVVAKKIKESGFTPEEVLNMLEVMDKYKKKMQGNKD